MAIFVYHARLVGANSVGEATDGDVGCTNPIANSVGEAADGDVGCTNPIATHRFSRGARRDQMVRRRETAPTVFRVNWIHRYHNVPNPVGANSVGEATDGDVGCTNPIANSVGEAADGDVGCTNPIATHRFSRGARRDQVVRRRETAPTVFRVNWIHRYHNVPNPVGANSVGEATDGDVGCTNPIANSVGEATDCDLGCANPIATHRFSRGARRDQMVRRRETAPTVFRVFGFTDVITSQIR